MNCIIQCLSNTRPLLEFCLDTEQHETDANASVRNGHLIKGKLCTSGIAVFHVSPGVSSKKRPRTGSTYISGTMRDSVEIPTAVLGFPITRSSKKVPQMIETITEIAIWPPKPEILYFSQTWSKTPELLLEFRCYLLVPDK